MQQNSSSAHNFPHQSLVKYDSPVLQSESNGKRRGLVGSRNGKKSLKNRKSLPPVENKSQLTQTEDILNSILPPKQFEKDNKVWYQYVSSTPATRLDVINLQEQLDQQLIQRKARETGICPVREQLYAQTFDELIRQVTVNTSERGLLLLRVRDEIRMTIEAYRTLYESSIAYGMRKALLSEQGKAEMIQKIKQLETEKDQAERTVREWMAKYEALEKRESERRKADEKKYEEEINFLKKQNQQYKQELDRIMSISK